MSIANDVPGFKTRQAEHDCEQAPVAKGCRKFKDWLAIPEHGDIARATLGRDEDQKPVWKYRVDNKTESAVVYICWVSVFEDEDETRSSVDLPIAVEYWPAGSKWGCEIERTGRTLDAMRAICQKLVDRYQVLDKFVG